MDIFRFIGLFAIIPATVLLTVSFFVLFTLRKAETQGLKAFGYVVAVLLWLAAFLFFSVGVYTVSSGNRLIMPMMQQMMGYPMHGMMGRQMPPMMQGQRQRMMKGQMPPMMQEKTQE